MMTDKQTAYEIIAHLIERFHEHVEEYKRGAYNEHQTRVDYINPFFKALGWDMDNTLGAAESYREVIHEDKIKIGSATKAPDYCFMAKGQRLFFVDAKKPSIFIKGDIHPAYQVRRYGWSAKVAVSIVTDFEEFALYDCTKKPKITDKASVCRINYITYDKYLEEFDFIWDTFAKESVIKGRFDKFVASDTRKKGTATVDDEFLKSIEQWRILLATNIALRNKQLDEEQLNYAVQKTIDRIIFLRMCEDRGVEPYGDIQHAANDDIYQNLLQLFRRADDKYNSGLFDFKEDTITPNIRVDSKILKTIVSELYYPNSEYEFSVMPADILGSVYERFLGNTIRLTKGHQAKVEQKPEVRKAGGVYYTPKYVVDYIVENTVSKLLEGKTPKEVEEITILDPACGSGSFLIGAYQFLLDWHLKYYTEHPPKKKKDSPLTPDGALTPAEKKRILVNNIYGVDIDTQAVEVTKLNLMLKALEGETKASINNQLSLFNDRVLPNLNQNIKCGNSLIGPDFYDCQTELFPTQMKKINAFDWKTGFPKAIRRAGFNVVIGNPPYVFGRDWKSLGISAEQKAYLGSNYQSSPYQLDMFSIFMEKTLALCRLNGFVGLIVPNVWLSNTYSSSTRSHIIGNSQNLTLAIPPKNVFLGITVDTVVYTLSKSKNPCMNFTVAKLQDTGKADNLTTLESARYIDGKEPISTSATQISQTLLDKILSKKKALGELAIITRGVHPYRVGGYGKSAFQNGAQIQKDVDERPYHSLKPKKGFRPFIYGKDIKRYSAPIAGDFVKYGTWLAEPRNPDFFDGERIYSRKILGARLIVTIERENSIADQQVYITKPNTSSHSIEYFAAILGSSVISYFIRTYYDEVEDAFPQIKVGQLKSLPVCLLDMKNKEQKNTHDILTQSIRKLFILNEQFHNASVYSLRETLQQTITHTEKRIDRIIYDLYGLTEDEIKLVEQ